MCLGVLELIFHNELACEILNPLCMSFEVKLTGREKSMPRAASTTRSLHQLDTSGEMQRLARGALSLSCVVKSSQLFFSTRIPLDKTSHSHNCVNSDEMANTSHAHHAQLAATAELHMQLSDRFPLELLNVVMESLLEYGLNLHGEPPYECNSIRDGQMQEIDGEIS
jgi:hypothetical protein